MLALGPRIVLAIGWLLFCGGYSVWAGVVQDDWLVAAVGGAVLLASFAALFRRSWSQWVIYAFVLYSGVVCSTTFGLAFALEASHFNLRNRPHFRSYLGSPLSRLLYGAQTLCGVDCGNRLSRPNKSLERTRER